MNFKSILSIMSIMSISAFAEVRDVSWFLKNMRNVDNLPAIENSHTEMISTWDTNEFNMDCWTHDNISGITNTIVAEDASRYA
ncbi:MAG: hypothetical protein DRI44_01760 [Chlamydiae bacterium]|nr:MAG: hypothetical protein DRI44_01760 [Chlamydiota bacterium]